MADIETLYTSNAYIKKNPDLHEADSPWKISVLRPFIDVFMKSYSKDTIVVLDVGGGAGVILRELSNYIETTYHKTVKKYCLDLSPGMLAVQSKNNPDAIKTICGDIAATGLENREVDLVLMVDVLEHVAEPIKVLAEIRRIAGAAIFKVPLEDSFYYRTMDRLTHGKFRARLIQKIGHINIYSVSSLRQLLETSLGPIVMDRLTKVYGYLLSTTQSLPDRLLNIVGFVIAVVSPSLAARLTSDYLVALVRWSDRA